MVKRLLVCYSPPYSIYAIYDGCLLGKEIPLGAGAGCAGWSIGAFLELKGSRQNFGRATFQLFAVPRLR